MAVVIWSPNRDESPQSDIQIGAIGDKKKDAEHQPNFVTSQQHHPVVVACYLEFQIYIRNSKQVFWLLVLCGINFGIGDLLRMYSRGLEFARKFTC